MSFTGKATYIAGATLPEIAEDVSDLIGIVSPYETPLLDAIGDPLRCATSTHHEWLEDELLPNKDETYGECEVDDHLLGVANFGRFRTGDQIQVEGSSELILVSHITDGMLTIVRGYAGTEVCDTIKTGSVINILGNAAVEGDGSTGTRFTTRTRKGNYTQIFTSAVEVNSDHVAASQLGLSDEMNYQKQERLRELLRDLENTVINGREITGDKAAAEKAAGTGSRPDVHSYTKTRRRVKGIISQIQTNSIDAEGSVLTEELVNKALRTAWENSNGNIDLLVVGGYQKRKINGFEKYVSTGNMSSLYEGDFGICKVICCRWVPQDACILLDSSRVNVLPLAGRSFHFKPIATGGNYEAGELVGEYTLELKSEAAHGIIRNLGI